MAKALSGHTTILGLMPITAWY